MRRAGNCSGLTLRCMSHMRRLASRSSAARRLRTQRAPQSPIIMMSGSSSRPAWVRWYLPATACRRRPALDHTFHYQAFQALRQQRRRHQGDAAPQFVEVRATDNELAQNQRGSPLGEDLCRLGDRAELPIALHGRQGIVPRRQIPVQILNLRVFMKEPDTARLTAIEGGVPLCALHRRS